MPQPFNPAVITDNGIHLLTRAQAGEIKIEFTRIETGNGTYEEHEKGSEVLRTKTGLKSTKNSFGLSGIKVHSENSVKVSALITNYNSVTQEIMVTEGYYINEIGLYAREKDGMDNTEVLYSIAVTSGIEGDFMPPYNGADPVEIIQDYYVTVDSSEEVTVQGDNRVPALAIDLQQAEEKMSVMKEKLDGIDENANNYTHPTTAGNKHIPSGGSAGQVLKYGGSSGTASWGSDSYYGTCSTEAATAAKTVSLSGFSLFTGATVAVMFSNGNTAANPTLNVNSTGAKAIYYRNTALTSSTAGIISKNGVYLFVYSGSCWQLTEDTGFNNNCTTLWSGIICNESEASVSFYVPKRYWHNDNLTLMIDCVKYQYGTGVISPPHSKTVMATVTRKREIYVVVDNVPVLDTYSATYDNGKVNKFNIHENFSMSGETTMDIMVDAEPLTTTDYAEVTVHKLDSSKYVITDIYAVMPQEQEG